MGVPRGEKNGWGAITNAFMFPSSTSATSATPKARALPAEQHHNLVADEWHDSLRPTIGLRLAHLRREQGFQTPDGDIGVDLPCESETEAADLSCSKRKG